MSEMGDRVARAMKLRASQPVGNLPSLEGALVGGLGDTWPYLAEAAMAAMREPTKAMEAAGAAAEGGCEPSCEHETILRPGLIWQAMIDAAREKRE